MSARPEVKWAPIAKDGEGEEFIVISCMRDDEAASRYIFNHKHGRSEVRFARVTVTEETSDGS